MGSLTQIKSTTKKGKRCAPTMDFLMQDNTVSTIRTALDSVAEAVVAEATPEVAVDIKVVAIKEAKEAKTTIVADAAIRDVVQVEMGMMETNPIIIEIGITTIQTTHITTTATAMAMAIGITTMAMAMAMAMVTGIGIGIGITTMTIGITAMAIAVNSES